MAAPTQVGSVTSGAPGATSSITPTLPTGWVADDVIWIALFVQNSGEIPSDPSGWTRVATVSWAGRPNVAVYRRKMASGDSAPTFSATMNDTIWAAIAYRNADLINPEDGVNTFSDGTSTSTIVCPAVTTTKPNDILVTVFGNRSAQTGTPPSGMTELLDLAQGTNVRMQLNVETLTTAGSTGTRTESLGGTGNDEVAVIWAVRENSLFTGWGIPL